MSKAINSINKVIDEVRILEEEIRELKRDKTQAEAFCATVIKKYGEKVDIEINLLEIFKSDFEKVKLYPTVESKLNVKVKYIEEKDETN
ncbi:hypothetical protein AF332_11620 [Sporosarcina globispora]|uniref:Uncharacterized protein n=1 Tax=Sporosarcina globispora TaxID=1459 RepID=A0A0M0GDA9_SPOGL|nr:hypothetical protein [Sporosarcina globispora]KON87411.1 hypothetical protein AF332_11620 [Sporosarcina globispora]